MAVLFCSGLSWGRMKDVLKSVSLLMQNTIFSKKDYEKYTQETSQIIMLALCVDQELYLDQSQVPAHQLFKLSMVLYNFSRSLTGVIEEDWLFQ